MWDNLGTDMPIQIRPIEPHQIADAKRVILSVAKNIFEWPAPLEDVIRQFDNEGKLSDVDEMKSYRPENRGLFLVAIDAGNVIGTGAIRAIDQNSAEIKRLWLLERYHGQGIGYRMVTMLLDFARQAGYRRIQLLTDGKQGRAIQFYRRIGFSELDCRSEDPEDVCMEIAI